MLHSLRRRLAEYAQRESAGESLWTNEFSDRTRILHVLTRTLQGSYAVNPEHVFAEARRVILEQEGGFTLVPAKRLTAADDFFQFYQACHHDMFPTVMEALVPALQRADEIEHSLGTWPEGWAASFARETNEIFAQERVGWELIDSGMVEVHSKELHVAAVEPALRLLHRAEFAKADKQYRDALDMLAQGKASNAITDAGATLQELLEALGCDGNQLGDLARSARKKGLLGAHDTPLIDAIEKTMQWVAADRSEMGDAHHATEATRDDAWLVIHVVGALVVRLAAGKPRKK